MNALLIGSALMMGIFGGVHCIGMCGPISAGLCASSQRTSVDGSGGDGSRSAAAKWSIAYNMGRVLTYGILGAVVGAIGAQLLGPPGVSGLWVKCLSAIAMVAVGAHLSGMVRIIAKRHLGLFGRIAQRLRRFLPIRRARVAIGIGMLWGLLPCGLVYGALVLALSTGSTAFGAVVMVAFGLGTLPLLVGIGYLGPRVLPWLSRPIWRKTAGLTLMVAGTLQLSVLVGDNVFGGDSQGERATCH